MLSYLFGANVKSPNGLLEGPAFSCRLLEYVYLVCKLWNEDTRIINQKNDRANLICTIDCQNACRGAVRRSKTRPKVLTATWHDQFCTDKDNQVI